MIFGVSPTPVSGSFVPMPARLSLNTRVSAWLGN